MTRRLLAPDGGPVPGDAARDAVRRELERPEYDRAGPSFVQRALDAVGRFLDHLLPDGGGGRGALLVVVALLVVGVVVLLRLAPTRARRTRADVRAAAADPLATVTAADHRRAAARLEAAGRRAEAVREWLRAAVATIEERGVLPPRPGRTGAATAREAGPLLPDAAEVLAAAVRAFDEIWFGGRPADDADVGAAHAAADAVQRARLATAASSGGLAVPS